MEYLYIIIGLIVILVYFWIRKKKPRNSARAKDRINGVKEQVSHFEKYRNKEDKDK